MSPYHHLESALEKLLEECKTHRIYGFIHKEAMRASNEMLLHFILFIFYIWTSHTAKLKHTAVVTSQGVCYFHLISSMSTEQHRWWSEKTAAVSAVVAADVISSWAMTNHLHCVRCQERRSSSGKSCITHINWNSVLHDSEKRTRHKTSIKNYI